MTSISNTIRKASTLIAAAALAGLATPAALADPPQGHRATEPDLVERIVISGRAASVGQTAVRPDDRAGARPVAISKSRAPVATVGADGFQWGDATIGAFAGVAFALLAGGALLSVRTRGRMAHS